MSPSFSPTVRITFQHSDTPDRVFPAFIEELTSSLRRRGGDLDPRKGGYLRPGRTTPGSPDSATVVEWDPGRGATFRWTRWGGKGGAPSELTLRLEPHADGTLLTLEHRGGTELLGEPAHEQLLGWVASEIFGPLFTSASPSGMRGWQIDRAARRPSGPAGRAQYREPVYHRPNFAEILQRLELGPHDRLLEVGCGGGAFLHEALKSGCRASAVDHSPDLLEVAGQQNERAVTSGHLRLEYADAAALPFPDAQFTCAVMTGVLGWLPRPEAVLREIWRTLRPGGRMIVYDGTPRMYGTPAAGPRILGGVRLYEDRELSALAKSAGFSRVRVDHPDLTGHAKASGIPGEALYLFEPEFNHILQAERPTDRSARAPRKSPGRPSRKGPGRGRSLTARSLAR